MLSNTAALSEKLKSETAENQALFSRLSQTDQNTSSLQSFLQRREALIAAITQLHRDSKAMEAQLHKLPEAVQEKIAHLHACIDDNLRAVIAFDQASMSVLSANIQLYRNQTAETRGKKKQIGAYLRSEIVGLDPHHYDRTR